MIIETAVRQLESLCIVTLVKEGNTNEVLIQTLNSSIYVKDHYFGMLH